MPKVSDAHLALRREEILLASMRCFARNGFHATSMAEVIEEAGVSAGSVYRYFPSKEALIHSAGEHVLSGIQQALEDIKADSPDASPVVIMRRLLRDVRLRLSPGDVDFSVVAFSVWSEALRDAELRDTLKRKYGAVRASIAESLTRWRDAGKLAVDTDTDALAAAFFAMIPGLLIQVHLLQDVEPDQALAALDALLVAAAPTTSAP